MTTDATLPVVDVADLSVTFGQQRALRSVELQVRPGGIHGLVGSNGSGKSTIVKVLAGYHFPDAHPRAQCRVRGVEMDLYIPPTIVDRSAFAFVHQDLALADSLSVLDNLRLSGKSRGMGGLSRIKWSTERDEAIALLHSVGLEHVDPKRPLKELTQSERVLVAMARALKSRRGFSLLVLDEATANVDSRDVGTIHRVAREVAARQGAVLYISHRIDEIQSICTEVTVLRDGAVVLSESMAQLDKPSLVSAMVGPRANEVLAEPTPGREPSVVATSGDKGPGTGLQVTDLSGGKCRSVTFSVDPGEIVGLIGLAGSGAEDVAPLIFGSKHATGGEILVAGEQIERSPTASIAAGMAYIPSDRRGTASFQSLSARDNAGLGNLASFKRGPWLSRHLEDREVRKQLVEAQVEPPNPSIIMRKLSGGNQQKLILSRWLRPDLRVLVLEQPTQGVDIETRARLYVRFRELADSGCAVLVVSSDEDELTALCDRVCVVVEGHISETIPRAMLSARELVRACHAAETASAAPTL